MKLTYSEQIKHPEWQKLRLEVLNSHNWKCEICGAKDKTLHVHHKQYIKGRMAWEYDRSNFEPLCEDCHENAHTNKAAIDTILAAIPCGAWGEVAAVLIGYFSFLHEESIEKARGIDDYPAHAELYGELANKISFFAVPEKIAAIIKKIEDAKPGEEITIKLPRSKRSSMPHLGFD